MLEKIKLAFAIFLLMSTGLIAQEDFFHKYEFTHADTLRGMLRHERTCFDVTFYHLNIDLDINNKSLGGYVDIQYDTKEDFHTLQLDLFKNMKIDKILHKEKEINYKRVENAVFVRFSQKQLRGKSDKIRVYYHGKPRKAKNPPWDGGFIWRKDKSGNPWIGVACEGLGASVWWPNKDHLSDEPDSMAISIGVPSELMCVSNGNLRSKENKGSMTKYHWFVSYPINNYNVTLNVGKYAHFKDTYTAFSGEKLDLDYYVMPENLEKAKKQFQQVKPMLACYERYFGKYPFWEDGYALVETSYLGMEHQGAIAYGNRYMKGYLGGMIPKGMDWDFIIIHESGHEYFGNSISVSDHADMWIHESFTTYMEALYLECTYDFDRSLEYLMMQKRMISNRVPIVGPRDVNWDKWGDSDNYYKGAWMLHTLRSTINNDAKWFDLLRQFYKKYAYSIVETDDFIHFVKEYTGKDYTSFFKQYLTYASIPTLEYRLRKKRSKLILEYRWNTEVEGFKMPVKVGVKDHYVMIMPSEEWQRVSLRRVKEKDFRIAEELFLIKTERLY